VSAWFWPDVVYELDIYQAEKVVRQNGHHPKALEILKPYNGHRFIVHEKTGLAQIGGSYFYREFFSVHYGNEPGKKKPQKEAGHTLF